MTTIPKDTGFKTSNEAFKIVRIFSSRLKIASLSNRVNTFSVITIEASTRSPKSIAPKLIRFAEIPKTFIKIAVKSIEPGMIAATMIEAFML